MDMGKLSTEIEFTPRSQAAQDIFVYEVLVKPEKLLNGTFLDIGCSHPVCINNTYALEELGWRGVLVDNDPNAIQQCRERRKSTVIEGDTAKLDWKEILKPFNGKMDYLSLDVDAASLDTLKALPLADVRFRVITIEHDKYRFGPKPQESMELLLGTAGYKRVCRDICNPVPFEDWWVDPNTVPLKNYKRFIADGKTVKEVLGL